MKQLINVMNKYEPETLYSTNGEDYYYNSSYEAMESSPTFLEGMVGNQITVTKQKFIPISASLFVVDVADSMMDVAYQDHGSYDGSNWEMTTDQQKDLNKQIKSLVDKFCFDNDCECPYSVPVGPPKTITYEITSIDDKDFATTKIINN